MLFIEIGFYHNFLIIITSIIKSILMTVVVNFL